MATSRRAEPPRPAWPSAGRVLFVAMIAALAGMVMGDAWPPLGREEHYLRLAPVRSGEVELVYDAMGWPRSGARGGTDPLDSSTRYREIGADQALRRLGERTGLALARALVRHDGRVDRRFYTSWYPDDDATSGHLLAWRYRECATPRADAALLAVARDRALHLVSRHPAIVALCRPGNRDDLDALADLAADLDEDPAVRLEVLARLPRIGGPAPRRLREILDVPFHGLDRAAAAALGAMGDLESPTLVSAALRECARDPQRVARKPFLFRPALDAVGRAAASSDPDLAQRVEKLLELGNGVWNSSRDREFCDATGDVADRFDAWIDVHPEARATKWERAHAEAAESIRRRLASHPHSVEELLAAPDREIDPVVAICRLRDGGDEVAIAVLHDLDRVARWLGPQLRQSRTPAESLRRMYELLAARRGTSQWGTDESDVTTLLHSRAGNCMGWTLYLLALGDRLGLPLHAVAVPEHVFVRWDDGATRVNFDATHGGAVLPDDAYARAHGGAEALAASGQWLRNLRRRELVSMALSNRAAHLIGPVFPGDGTAGVSARLAETAARLDARNPYAWQNLAIASAQLGDARSADVQRAAAAAELLPGFTGDSVTKVAHALASVHLGDEALAILDRHADAGRDDRFVRARAHCSVGRYSEARRITRDLVADEGDAMAVFDAALAFSERPADGWVALDALVRRPELAERGPWRERVTLAVAKHVLTDGPPTADRARLVIEILAKFPPDGDVRTPYEWGVRTRFDDSERDALRARARALLGDSPPSTQDPDERERR